MALAHMDDFEGFKISAEKITAETGYFLFVESDRPPPPGPVLSYIDPFLTVSLLYPFLSFLTKKKHPRAELKVPESHFTGLRRGEDGPR